MEAFRLGFLFLLTLAGSTVDARFPWGGGSRMKPGGEMLGPGLSASQLLQTGSRLSNTYELALLELQQLESEPLCHRIAARLLVNNCQLLDGKDDATMLTDSGRQVRDFVDAYAASLAICDLERGRFAIPEACTKFREPALSQLHFHDAANLHVTSKEIDGCLSGLGASDSAWNTWVSYRHKALRFCEAARADNDRSQSIRTFQRLVKIMGKLADGAEERLDRLKQGLDNAEHLISEDLAHALARSAKEVDTGIENAANLQRMLAAMLQTVLDTNARMASAHEQSLEVATRKAESEMDSVMTALAAAVSSSATLQNQIELSRFYANQLGERQDNMEQEMQRLADMTETLSSKYDDHYHLLLRAQNMTHDILETLESTAASVADFTDSFLARSSAMSWWSYIWCPVVSLVLGSYGLPPSASRNFILLTVGELAAFLVSSFDPLPLPFSAGDLKAFFVVSPTTATYFGEPTPANASYHASEAP